MRWSAVITAGGITPAELATATNAPHKALAKVGGKTSIQRVIDAIRAAHVEEIVVVADDKVLASLDDYLLTATPGHNPASSARSGVDKLNNPEAILFIPADTPLLEPAHLQQFSSAIIRRVRQEAWLAIGLCRAAEITKINAPHKPIKLKGYPAVASSLMAASASGFSNALNVVEKASANRKSQLKIAMTAGLLNLIRYLTGTLTLSRAEMAAGRILRSQAIIIQDCHPHSALDIDDVADWHHLKEYARRLGLE